MLLEAALGGSKGSFMTLSSTLTLTALQHQMYKHKHTHINIDNPEDFTLCCYYTVLYRCFVLQEHEQRGDSHMYPYVYMSLQVRLTSQLKHNKLQHKFR